jgi:hypothetical protein
MPKKTPYSVRRARFPQDRLTLIDIWRGNLGDPDQLDRKYEWFYESSPTGWPLAMLLEFDDETHDSGSQPVGVAAAGPRSFQVGNKQVDAAVLVDMAVSKQHRTLYPALLLQRTLLAEGLSLTPLLYGFPNRKAAPVFHRAGYRKLGMIVRYVRVLRAGEYLRNSLPNWIALLVGPSWDLLTSLTARLRFLGAGKLDLKWGDINEAAVETSSAIEDDMSLLCGDRSDEFLRWRFMSNGKRDFGFVSVSSSANDSNAGYWIVESASSVLHVRDCSPCLLIGANAGRAWMLFFEQARRRGFSSVSFECLAPHAFVHRLKRYGMRPRSERPVYGAVRDDYATLVNSSQLYFTGADEDE